MNGYSKSIIRDAMADIVPKEVMYRKHKSGFHPPMDAWLKNELKQWFMDQVNSGDILNAEFIDGISFRAKCEDYFKGESKLTGGELWEEFLIYGWEKSLKIASQKFGKYNK
jgi:asparagine synthase (glutamine-hydrolysing)